NVDRLRIVREQLHSVGLDQQVDHEGASGLPLAVQAMTAMREEWIGRQPVANRSTRATTLTCDAHELLLRVAGHAPEPRLGVVQLSNEFEVSAPLERTWSLLNDVPRVMPCLPGAELSRVVGENEWEATLHVKLGPISLRFLVEVMRQDVDEQA